MGVHNKGCDGPLAITLQCFEHHTVWGVYVTLGAKELKPHSMEAYRGVKIKLHAFLATALDWGEWSASDPDFWTSPDVLIR